VHRTVKLVQCLTHAIQFSVMMDMDMMQQLVSAEVSHCDIVTLYIGHELMF
jgi:hypothetical protein